jgi:hypothetical protein
MSIDIASKKVNVPQNVIKLDEVVVGARDVYAFDFDGVLSSPVEDDIYHLLSWSEEEDLLDRARRIFELKCELMEPKYQRHLIFQAAAYYLDIPIESGPGLSLLNRCAKENYIFVITARSGWYAVSRMRKFLNDADIVPIEIFNLGRIKKERQINLLCQEFDNSAVYYIEDNAAHLEAVSIIDNDRLNLVWAERERSRLDEVSLRNLFVSTVENAIILREKA